MKYVYILNSIAFPDRHYTGLTEDLKARLIKHHAKEVSHTSKYAPWRLKTYIAFSDEAQAVTFENILNQPLGVRLPKEPISDPPRHAPGRSLTGAGG